VNPSHASRHPSPASSAIGAATSTPQPVPELIVAIARERRRGGSKSPTTSANGGNTSPPLPPATKTPTARTAPLGATAITVIPAIASAPPATTTARGPKRAVSAPADATASRYEA
jgi:hypothetical protein